MIDESPIALAAVNLASLLTVGVPLAAIPPDVPTQLPSVNRQTLSVVAVLCGIVNVWLAVWALELCKIVVKALVFANVALPCVVLATPSVRPPAPWMVALPVKLAALLIVWPLIVLATASVPVKFAEALIVWPLIVLLVAMVVTPLKAPVFKVRPPLILPPPVTVKPPVPWIKPEPLLTPTEVIKPLAFKVLIPVKAPAAVTLRPPFEVKAKVPVALPIEVLAVPVVLMVAAPVKLVPPATVRPPLSVDKPVTPSVPPKAVAPVPTVRVLAPVTLVLPLKAAVPLTVRPLAATDKPAKLGVAAVLMFWMVLMAPAVAVKLVLLKLAIPLAAVVASSIVTTVPAPVELDKVSAPERPSSEVTVEPANANPQFAELRRQTVPFSTGKLITLAPLGAVKFRVVVLAPVPATILVEAPPSMLVVWLAAPRVKVPAPFVTLVKLGVLVMLTAPVADSARLPEAETANVPLAFGTVIALSAAVIVADEKTVLKALLPSRKIS